MTQNYYNEHLIIYAKTQDGKYLRKRSDLLLPDAAAGIVFNWKVIIFVLFIGFVLLI